jgi:hypothetical protein
MWGEPPSALCFLGFLAGRRNSARNLLTSRVLPGKIVLMAGFDLFLQRFILLVQVILYIVDVHDAYNRKCRPSPG